MKKEYENVRLSFRCDFLKYINFIIDLSKESFWVPTLCQELVLYSEQD